MTWLSKRRCDANQAAWATYCPNQSPEYCPCPCVFHSCPNQVYGCFGGRCTAGCLPAVDAASDVAFATNGDGGPYCGDGVVNGAEECDDGILDGSYGGCTPLCTLAPYCGDGILNGPEECDHGADNGRDGMCSQSCKVLIWPPP